MSKQYFNFGSGWFKTKGDGEEYLSCSVGNRKNPIKLFAQLEDGSSMEVTSFAAFTNKNKQSENHPDFQFTFSVDS